METTYEAIITGDRITWIGDRPDAAASVHVRVHVDRAVNPPAAHGDRLPAGIDGRELAALCEDIAARTGGIRSIPDPVAWQREQRADRPLPGREP